MSSTAGFGWAARLEAIRELLMTETFAEGLAWFREHPQPEAGAVREINA